MFHHRYYTVTEPGRKMSENFKWTTVKIRNLTLIYFVVDPRFQSLLDLVFDAIILLTRLHTNTSSAPPTKHSP